MEEEAVLTNSPSSPSIEMTSLLLTPYFLASSETRVLATVVRCSFWPDPRVGQTLVVGWLIVRYSSSAHELLLQFLGRFVLVKCCRARRGTPPAARW